MTDPVMNDFLERFKELKEEVAGSEAKNPLILAIRDKLTGEMVSYFDDVVDARNAIARRDRDRYVLMEQVADNVYRQFPDGRTYIVGVEYRWIVFEDV